MRREMISANEFASDVVAPFSGSELQQPEVVVKRRPPRGGRYKAYHSEKAAAIRGGRLSDMYRATLNSIQLFCISR